MTLSISKNDEFLERLLNRISATKYGLHDFQSERHIHGGCKCKKAVQAAINRDLINQNFYIGEGTLLNYVLPPAIPDT